MDLVGGLLQPIAGNNKVAGWLHTVCAAPRQKLMTVDWVGAPKEKTMRAAVVSSFGSAEEMEVKSVNLPFELDDDELLVEVHAASVNAADCMMRRGELHKDALPALPAVLGMDVSGVVRKVGQKVTGFLAGQCVFGRQTAERLSAGRNGSYAEWCVVDALDVVLKPDAVSHEMAAACPTAALTALAALTSGGLVAASSRNTSPKKIVVTGASGGVGSFALQIAKNYFDAHVVAVCSTTHKDMVAKLGADKVIDYTDPDWKSDCTKLHNFDLVLDCVGLDDYWEVFGRQVLGPHGKYVSLTALKAEAVSGARKKSLTLKQQQQGMTAEEDLTERLERQTKERLLKAKSGMLNLGGGIFTGFSILASKDVSSTDLRLVRQLLQDGMIKPAIDSVHDIRDIVAAHKISERMHAAGKIVVRVRKPWERESVQGFDLKEAGGVAWADDGRKTGDMSREDKKAAIKKKLEGGNVPLCSLGKIDREGALAGQSKGTPRERKPRPLLLSIAEKKDPSAPVLPDGWESAYDPDGDIYYYNRDLNVSQYEHPATGAVDAQHDEQQPQQQQTDAAAQRMDHDSLASSQHDSASAHRSSGPSSSEVHSSRTRGNIAAAAARGPVSGGGAHASSAGARSTPALSKDTGHSAAAQEHKVDKNTGNGRTMHAEAGDGCRGSTDTAGGRMTLSNFGAADVMQDEEDQEMRHERAVAMKKKADAPDVAPANFKSLREKTVGEVYSVAEGDEDGGARNGAAKGRFTAVLDDTLNAYHGFAGGADGGATRGEQGLGRGREASEQRPGPLMAKIAQERREATTSGPVQCGLGITLKQNQRGKYFIRRLESGGPADMSGDVKANDIIHSVNGMSVDGISYQELAALVLGPEGTTVVLKLEDPCTGEVRSVALQRFPIDPNVLKDNERLMELKRIQQARAEKSIEEQAKSAANTVTTAKSDEQSRLERELEELARMKLELEDQAQRRRQALTPTAGNEAMAERKALQDRAKQHLMQQVHIQKTLSGQHVSPDSTCRRKVAHLADLERKATEALVREHLAATNGQTVLQEQQLRQQEAEAVLRAKLSVTAPTSPNGPNGGPNGGSSNKTPVTSRTNSSKSSPNQDRQTPRVLYAQPVADDIPCVMPAEMLRAQEADAIRIATREQVAKWRQQQQAPQRCDQSPPQQHHIYPSGANSTGSGYPDNYRGTMCDYPPTPAALQVNAFRYHQQHHDSGANRTGSYGPANVAAERVHV